jgi:hypothetical protein
VRFHGAARPRAAHRGGTQPRVESGRPSGALFEGPPQIVDLRRGDVDLQPPRLTEHEDDAHVPVDVRSLDRRCGRREPVEPERARERDVAHRDDLGVDHSQHRVHELTTCGPSTTGHREGEEQRGQPCNAGGTRRDAGHQKACPTDRYTRGSRSCRRTVSSG